MCCPRIWRRSALLSLVSGPRQRPVGHRERLGKGTIGRIILNTARPRAIMTARPTCSLFPPASRWSRSSTTFSRTPNTSTGCKYRKPGEAAFKARPECRFHTQRAAGSTFTFGVQGDSHPERPQMNDPELYARTLLNAASGHPDFYICMGDDFSVDTLRTINADTVAERYALQRPFLGLVAQSAPLFLVNGNHEQASLFNFNQSDVRHDVAVWAAKRPQPLFSHARSRWLLHRRHRAAWNPSDC